ncbi:MAG: response regulator transcription factor [Nitrospirota bacterium]
MNDKKPAYQAKKPIILIVEDHDTLRDSLQKWLKALFPESEFIEGKNSDEALIMTEKRSPDIVLMDIKLPQLDGIETTRRLKKTAPETRIIMLSMYDAPEYRTAAQSAGATAYVPKHRMHDELVPLLKELLSDLKKS